MKTMRDTFNSDTDRKVREHLAMSVNQIEAEKRPRKWYNWPTRKKKAEDMDGKQRR